MPPLGIHFELPDTAVLPDIRRLFEVIMVLALASRGFAMVGTQPAGPHRTFWRRTHADGGADGFHMRWLFHSRNRGCYIPEYSHWHHAIVKVSSCGKPSLLNPAHPETSCRPEAVPHPRNASFAGHGTREMKNPDPCSPAA